MRRRWAWAGTAAVMAACSGGGGNPAALAEADTLAVEDTARVFYDPTVPDEEPPRIGHEARAFSDIFYLYVRDKAFQAGHTRFPLPIEEADSVRTITSGRDLRAHFQWPEPDEYTLLLTRAEQIEELQNSLELDSVRAQVIDLATLEARTYHFAKDSVHWQLEASTLGVPSGRQGEFLAFYARFVVDEEFQQSSLAREIRFSTTDPDDENLTMEGILLPSQWPAFRPELPAGLLTNFVFGQDYEQADRITLMRCGADCSMMQSVTFARERGQWLLVSFDN